MATILVIDDDAAVRGLLEAVLRNHGHDVVLAANASEGYTVLQKAPIEMVITDFEMPGGNGLEVVSVVKKEFPATKVMLVSGAGKDYLPIEAEIVSKPFAVTQFIETVHRLLESA